MSRILLHHSMFDRVLFPPEVTSSSEHADALTLRRSVRYQVAPQACLRDIPLVVFDLETTGLDANVDEIIEIGAQKLLNGVVISEMSTLVYTKVALSKTVTRITGITSDMLEAQPQIDMMIPRFFEFIQGSLLCAHNASFDMGFIKRAATKLGLDLDWPVFCTLKMARDLLPDLERKNLDSLAQHYQLSFEARHRSIGDVKVTTAVLQEMLGNEGESIVTWEDMNPYKIIMVAP